MVMRSTEVGGFRCAFGGEMRNWMWTVGLALCVACSGSDDFKEVQSSLGIVRLDTKGEGVGEDREWVDVDLAFIEGSADSPANVEDKPTWSGHGAIHLRGNSSMGYDKKQYALETRDAAGNDIDVEPFGLPEEEDWVLHAPYSDKTPVSYTHLTLPTKA